jgi:putative ABC transport system permease protein
LILSVSDRWSPEVNLATAFQIAFRALGRNKMRSALTILGITIGISAVICTVAIGQGGSAMIQQQLAGLGENMIWVEAGGRNVSGVRTGNGATKSLTAEDSRAIKDLIPHVIAASPNVDGSIQIAYGNQNWATRFRGVSEEYPQIRKWDIARGNNFSEKDVNDMANVCLVGHTVAQQLFGDADPIGETFRMGTIPCRVIGTLQTKGQSSSGQDQDDLIVIPYTVAMHKLRGVSWIDDAYFSVDSADNISSTEDSISGLLRQRHHLRTDEPDDFNIRHPEDILQAQEQTSETFTLMLGSIASVSLLVGGIGIMNIMLVSVTERTREIGVRMAIGATENDVKAQFLIESIALSLTGGVGGIVIGIAASSSISRILEWPTDISILAILVAVVFAAGIGVLFGYYPARKASELDPIEALRYE